MAQDSMTDDPCPRCLALVDAGVLDPEMLQRVPAGALAPVAHDGTGKCCRDCASADGLAATCGSFEAARVAVGNDRVDSYRLPPALRMGLLAAGRMSDPTETLNEHHAWLDRVFPGWAG